MGRNVKYKRIHDINNDMAYSLILSCSQITEKVAKMGGKLGESIPPHMFGCKAGSLKILLKYYLGQILTLKKLSPISENWVWPTFYWEENILF